MKEIHPDAYHSIQDLSRIAQASARWLAEIASSGRMVDPNAEYDHIKANLNHIGKTLGFE